MFADTICVVFLIFLFLHHECYSGIHFLIQLTGSVGWGINLEPIFNSMMNLVQKLTVTAVAVMPVFLCGCPGASYVDNDPSPKGYVVKMKNDYSDKVFVRMSIDNYRDTSFCCPRKDGHTIKITGKYYDLYCFSYDAAAYTSINSKDWKDYMLDSISKYVIDTNPFDEVYAYYKNYSIDELKKFIEDNNFEKFEREKWKNWLFFV